MVYDPQKHPKKSLIMISILVFVGIIGSVISAELVLDGYVNDYMAKFFPLIILIFWMQYTIVLSYRQFKDSKKRAYKNVTQALLHPQVRFFLFLLLGLYGIYNIFLGELMMAYLILIFWWLFALNFYAYYNKQKIKQRNGNTVNRRRKTTSKRRKTRS